MKYVWDEHWDRTTTRYGVSINMWRRTTSPLPRGRLRLQIWRLSRFGWKCRWAVVRNSRPFVHTRGAPWLTRGRGIRRSDGMSLCQSRPPSSCVMLLTNFARGYCSIEWSIFFESWVSNPFGVVSQTSKSLKICLAWSKRSISGYCCGAGTFGSKRGKESNLSGRRACAGLFYYSLYSRNTITLRKFETLRDSLRHVCPANFHTGFDHDFPLLG